MRIAYLTTDEVNRYLADREARACSATLEGTPRKGTPSEDGPDAVLYDLDHLPSCPTRIALDALFAGRLRIPAAVHGYGLDDRQSDELRHRGVIVARSLETGLIEQICHLAESTRSQPRRLGFRSISM